VIEGMESVCVMSVGHRASEDGVPSLSRADVRGGKERSTHPTVDDVAALSLHSHSVSDHVPTFGPAAHSTRIITDSERGL
jgi:hypothetical protein